MVFFLPTRATRSGERARFVGLFKDAQGFEQLDAGSRADFTQLKASTTLDLGISTFLILYDLWP